MPEAKGVADLATSYPPQPINAASIAERLRAARLRARYSQEEVERFAAIPRGGLAAWEKGRAVPTAAQAARVSVMFGLTPDALFGAALLAAMGHDPAIVATLAAQARRPPAPRQRSKVGAASGVLPPCRCGSCGRWVALRAPTCRACEVTGADTRFRRVPRPCRHPKMPGRRSASPQP
jgi:transcriptional regulator with XRE-family HTH domain